MIRLLVLDVDGTLTDGGIYYDSHGNELKKFAAKDGAGLLIARAAGIRVMICTGRECEAVRRRAADFGFVLRYPAGKEAVTGIAHEPWHFRYITPAGCRLQRLFFNNIQFYLTDYFHRYDSFHAQGSFRVIRH